MSTTNTPIKKSANFEEFDPDENIEQTNEIIVPCQESHLLYGLNEKPALFLSILLGLQHYITMLGGTITYPYILTTKLCMRENDPARGAVIATTLFCSGIATYIQTTFGIRLPIVQGATFTFLVPTLAILSLPQWQCPTDGDIVAARFHSSTDDHHEIAPMNQSADFNPFQNLRDQILSAGERMILGDRSNIEERYLRDHPVTEEEYTEVWQLRMREISGAILAASLIEVVLGMTGLIGYLMRFITPLSIVPTITLIGLSLFKEATTPAGESWLISGLTIILVLLMSQYLTKVSIPIPMYQKGGKRFGFKNVQIIKMFPVLITISISWTLCYILTVSSALPQNHPARTDGGLSRLISRSPWIRIPYPFQFGFPTFSSSAILGMIAGTIASALESVGDYYAAAKLCSAEKIESAEKESITNRSNPDRLSSTAEQKKVIASPYPPPISAVNRGIFMEGIGCVISGIFGSGGGLTSYSENIGAIGITKVASRHVVQMAAIMMIFLSLFVKVSAVLATIPVPIIGGILMTMFGICSGVGLSSLQYIDLNSSRNLTILGTSLFLGLSIPKWIQEHPDSIKTGSETFDQVLFVLSSTSMLVGGFIGAVLDNTIPGTTTALTANANKESAGRNSNYDLPPLINNWMLRHDWMKYFPMSPTFDSNMLGQKLSIIFPSTRFFSTFWNRIRRKDQREETKIGENRVHRNSIHLNIT